MAVLEEHEIARLPQGTRILELGCGQIKRCPTAVTLDINPDSMADVVHDLNSFPYPFDDNAFDIVIAEHVLEHLGDLIRVVEELHRILKPGGLLYVEVPHFSSNDHFTDPTHLHAFGFRSFDYFVPGEDLSRYKYSKAKFKKQKVYVLPLHGGLLRRLLARRIMRYYETWEKRYAFMLPADRINFELQAIK
jgi:SAM-dependent methyltransferase